jgi:hypothetical protein
MARLERAGLEHAFGRLPTTKGVQSELALRSLNPTTDHVAPNEERQHDDRQNDQDFDQHVFSFACN